MVRRGQAAMEFLMTYGWAILVVLAAIGALAYFGVLSPDRFLPDKCVFNPPLSCAEYKIGAHATAGTVTVGIQNNAGVALSGINITMTSPDCTPTTALYSNTSTQDNGRKINGENIVWTCDAGLSAGDRFQADFDVTYQKAGENVWHSSSGSVQGRTEE